MGFYNINPIIESASIITIYYPDFTLSDLFLCMNKLKEISINHKINIYTNFSATKETLVNSNIECIKHLDREQFIELLNFLDNQTIQLFNITETWDDIVLSDNSNVYIYHKSKANWNKNNEIKFLSAVGECNQITPKICCFLNSLNKLMIPIEDVIYASITLFSNNIMYKDNVLITKRKATIGYGLHARKFDYNERNRNYKKYIYGGSFYTGNELYLPTVLKFYKLETLKKLSVQKIYITKESRSLTRSQVKPKKPYRLGCDQYYDFKDSEIKKKSLIEGDEKKQYYKKKSLFDENYK